MDPDLFYLVGSVSDDPDPGRAGSRSQICQKLFILEQNFNKCKAGNAKCSRIWVFKALFDRQRKSTKFFFPKKAERFRNFEFLSRFGQIGSVIIRIFMWYCYNNTTATMKSLAPYLKANKLDVVLRIFSLTSRADILSAFLKILCTPLISKIISRGYWLILIYLYLV